MKAKVQHSDFQRMPLLHVRLRPHHSHGNRKSGARGLQQTVRLPLRTYRQAILRGGLTIVEGTTRLNHDTFAKANEHYARPSFAR